MKTFAIICISAVLLGIGWLLLGVGGQLQQAPETQGRGDMNFSAAADTITFEKIELTEEEWKEKLTPRQYRILREQGTEVPFLNEYWDNKKQGIYHCAACGLPLYSSETKYKSGTGWPSFWDPVQANVVEEREDNSFFMTRTEIVCARCGSHIGHVFTDGPAPTGLRYCMNSAALRFEENDSTGTSTSSGM